MLCLYIRAQGDENVCLLSSSILQVFPNCTIRALITHACFPLKQATSKRLILFSDHAFRHHSWLDFYAEFLIYLFWN